MLQSFELIIDIAIQLAVLLYILLLMSYICAVMLVSSRVMKGFALCIILLCTHDKKVDGFSNGQVIKQCSSDKRRRIDIPTLSAVSADISSSSPASAVVDFYANLDTLYDKTSGIKCPFFRRRAADLIDNAAMIGQFLLIRHKSLPGISDLFLDNHLPEEMELSAPGCKPLGRHIKRHPDGTADKTRHLSITDITQRIHNDWIVGVAGIDKGYYITGKLDSTIYRDDCLFDGPDPDMPVRGLRKYLSAASHLFDPRESDAQLLSITHNENGGDKGYGMIEVTWRLGGVIMLPWHPRVEAWTGRTKYHLDEEGLIYLHEEEWDISVWKAFICTLYPNAKTWGIWEEEREAVVSNYEQKELK